MQHLKTSILFAAMFSGLFFFCHHSPSHNHDHGHSDESANAKRPSQLHLPDDIRVVLKKEMNLVEQGMKDLHLAIEKKDSSGGKIAGKIKDSFILNQQLSEKQMKTLDSSLPAEFLKMDIHFHNTAGDLKNQLETGKFQEARKTIKTMEDLCISCHTKYRNP